MAKNEPSNRAYGAVVERDCERFKLLFTNGRPEIPADLKADVRVVTTRQLIREELARLRA